MVWDFVPWLNMASHFLCLPYYVYNFCYQGDFMVWDACSSSSSSHQVQSQPEQNRKQREGLPSPRRMPSPLRTLPRKKLSPLCMSQGPETGSMNWYSEGRLKMSPLSQTSCIQQTFGSPFTVEAVDSGRQLDTVPALWPLHCGNISAQERNTCLLTTTQSLCTYQLGSQWWADMSSSCLLCLLKV